jgi:hypothetical protein
MDRESSQAELLQLLRDIHRYTRFVYGFFVVYAMLIGAGLVVAIMAALL